MSSSSSKIVAIAHTLLIPTLLVIVIAAYENAPTFPHLSLFLPSMMRGLPRWRIIVVCLLPVCHDISSSLSYPRQTLWSNVTPSHNHLSPPNVQGWLLCYYYRANLTLTADTATDVDSCLHCCSCHHCREYTLIDISLPISSGGETWEQWFLSFYRSYKHQSKMAVLRRLMR